ncbi:MAG: pirin family protein [Deltaproteobacteria bacterium]|nr:pirin family protein [Deltaproteobacteria bacterium]
MITIRKSGDRGHANHGWLNSHHTFSFAGYQDPEFSGFSRLLVINEDRVAPGQGFGTHGHRDMEIVSYVLEGELEHKDSLGTGSVLKYGDVQRMSAGMGVRHSEFNPSKKNPVHFLQIWIVPQKEGIKPAYEEKHFTTAEKKNRLKLIVSPDGREGSLLINQDAAIYASILEQDKAVEQAIKPGRSGWLQVIRGTVELNGVALDAGDGASITDEKMLQLKARPAAEFLLFDLP